MRKSIRSKFAASVQVVAMLVSLSLAAKSGASVCTDTGTWSQLAATGSVGRYENTAIWDPIYSRMMVFGGKSSNGDILAGIYQYKEGASPAWTWSVPTAPPSMAGHVAIYDPVRQRMLVFGGAHGISQGMPDDPVGTWAYSLTSPGWGSWTKLNATGSPPLDALYVSTAVYDRDRDRMVVVCSEIVLGAPQIGVWMLNLATNVWVKQDVGPGGLPPASRGVAAVYDAANQQLVVFGGFTIQAGCRIYSDGYWALPLNVSSPSWQSIAASPAGARAEAAATYDEQCGRMIVYGGITSAASACGCDQAEVAVGVVETLTLTTAGILTPVIVNPAGTPPVARGHLALAHDSGPKHAVYFLGGGNDKCVGTTPGTTARGDGWKLQLPDVVPPAPPYVSVALSDVDLALTWEDSGDDGLVGNAAYYEVRSSSAPITNANFGSAFLFDSGIPGSPGTAHNLVGGLPPCGQFRYYAVRYRDESNNWGDVGTTFTKRKCTSARAGEAVPPSAAMPTSLALAAPRPNPTKGACTIRFDVPAEYEGQTLSLAIYDVGGRRLASLREGEAAAGSFTADWNGLDEGGQLARSGVYFARLVVGAQRLTQQFTRMP